MSCLEGLRRLLGPRVEMPLRVWVRGTGIHRTRPQLSSVLGQALLQHGVRPQELGKQITAIDLPWRFRWLVTQQTGLLSPEACRILAVEADPDVDDEQRIAIIRGVFASRGIAFEVQQ